MNQEDFQNIIFEHSDSYDSSNQMDIQFLDESWSHLNDSLYNNQQQQIQIIAPDLIQNLLGQKILLEKEYDGNLQQALNYHLLKMVFSYLNGVELVQAKQTCQYFNLLIRLQRYKEEQNKTEIVMDNGIQKYMEVGLEKIRDWNLVALKFVVSSKDQGYATASYSSSWVTLKLIKPENDNLNHGRDSQNFDEVMIIENYRVKKFKNHTIIITPFENKNDKLTKFFNHIKGGTYDKLAIVMKCQYPGWVCQIQYASIEFIMLEKD